MVKQTLKVHSCNGNERCHRVRVGLTKTQRQSKLKERCILIKDKKQSK